MKRIKSIRQKNSNNGFDPAIPFGADGKNIDMLSGLNLEEEFKLGGLQNYNIKEEEIKETIENQIITSIQTTISGQFKTNNDSSSPYEKVTHIIKNNSTGTTISSFLNSSPGTTKRILINEVDGETNITSTWITE